MKTPLFCSKRRVPARNNLSAQGLSADAEEVADCALGQEPARKN